MEAIAPTGANLFQSPKWRVRLLGLLLAVNVGLFWFGLTENAVTVGVTVKQQFLGRTFRFSDERATYSILDAIWKLRSDGNSGLFVVVLLFSVVFPTVKLAGNVWIWLRASVSHPGARTRSDLKAWARRLGSLGKWSMLEVFMAGLLCALLKAGDMVRLVIEPGLYWFVAAVLVSIVNAILTKQLVADAVSEGDPASG